MASLCFAALIKAHHLIPQPAQPVETAAGVFESLEQLPRPCTDDDIEGLPDDIGYRLAMEHLGYSRCEAAFRRWTFDRTGDQIAPDPRAIDFWRNLDNVTLMTPSQWRAASHDAPPLPFDVSSAIRERAYAALGEDLANDYMRATCRLHATGYDEPLYSLAVLLLAVLVPAPGDQ